MNLEYAKRLLREQDVEIRSLREHIYSLIRGHAEQMQQLMDPIVQAKLLEPAPPMIIAAPAGFVQQLVDNAVAAERHAFEKRCEFITKEVAAAEREACAKLCDEHMTDDNLDSCNERTAIRHELAEHLGNKIRARGQA